MAGMTAEEIAEAHFVAVTTVRSQIRAVLDKLGVRSQLVAVAAAHRFPLDARDAPTSGLSPRRRLDVVEVGPVGSGMRIRPGTVGRHLTQPKEQVRWACAE